MRKSTNTTTTARVPMRARAETAKARVTEDTRDFEPEPAPRRSSVKPDGLTRKQIQELHLRMLAMRDEILEKIHGKAGTFQAGIEFESLTKGDDAEVAEKQRASNATLQELDFLKGRLALVERAISKVEADSYGVCEETDEPIGYERLLIVPWARFCVDVQERRERKLRDFRGSRLRSEL
jgi:DnaK suppressor protein